MAGTGIGIERTLKKNKTKKRPHRIGLGVHVPPQLEGPVALLPLTSAVPPPPHVSFHFKKSTVQKVKTKPDSSPAGSESLKRSWNFSRMTEGRGQRWATARLRLTPGRFDVGGMEELPELSAWTLSLLLSVVLVELCVCFCPMILIPVVNVCVVLCVFIYPSECTVIV